MSRFKSPVVTAMARRKLFTASTEPGGQTILTPVVTSPGPMVANTAAASLQEYGSSFFYRILLYFWVGLNKLIFFILFFIFILKI